jgi:hypothetical protein
MEKHQLEREILKNITKRKFYFLTIMILIVISGFLLFNQINYLNSIYDEERSRVQTEKVRIFNLGISIQSLRYFHLGIKN